LVILRVFCTLLILVRISLLPGIACASLVGAEVSKNHFS
jgi:hypothetical protein